MQHLVGVRKQTDECQSLLGIMSMCIGTGASVEVSADGPDEQEAVRALCDMLQRDVA